MSEQLQRVSPNVKFGFYIIIWISWAVQRWVFWIQVWSTSISQKQYKSQKLYWHSQKVGKSGIRVRRPVNKINTDHSDVAVPPLIKPSISVIKHLYIWSGSIQRQKTKGNKSLQSWEIIRMHKWRRDYRESGTRWCDGEYDEQISSCKNRIKEKHKRFNMLTII